MKRTKRNQNGGAMVEFALAVPLFLLLVFGIIEFAFAMFQWVRVVDATREGARAAIVNDVACDPGICTEEDGGPIACICDEGKAPVVCGTELGSLSSDSPIIEAMNRRKLGVGVIPNSQVTVTYRCSDAGFDKRGEPVPQVTVEFTWPHAFLIGGLVLGPDAERGFLMSSSATRLGEDLHTP